VSGRILLIEDEAPLLQLLERHLVRLGFEVDARATAGAGLEALETAPPDRYDLAVADMGLPDMPGEALLAKMFEIRPDLRVLICSGAEFFISTLPPAMQPRVAFLQKPFPPKELAQKIAEMQSR
jgi:DNA-binding NtrC family response regulator